MEKKGDQKNCVGVCYRALSFLVRTFPLHRRRQIGKGRSNSALGKTKDEHMHKEEGNTEVVKVVNSTTTKYQAQEEKNQALEEDMKNKERSRILRPIKPITRAISNINERSYAYIEDKKKSFASQ